MRRRFYANEIMNEIIKRINNNHDLDFVKTVSKGDFSLVQDIKDFKKLFPAVFIDPEDIFTDSTIGNKSISPSKYNFMLQYVQYYEQEDPWIAKEATIDNGEKLADTLLNDENLSRFRFKEGEILYTEVPHIQVKSGEEQIFRLSKIPVFIVSIEYSVYFRSFIRR